MAEKGIIVVLSGFSGAGKGTVLKVLLDKYPDYALSVSYTTRAPREGEKNGVNYYFVTDEEFQGMIRENGFYEYACYTDCSYGTPRKYVDEKLAKGIDVILEIEVQGAMQIKQQFPDTPLIFLTTPSAEILRERLIGRGTETPEKIRKRLANAAREAKSISAYDYLLINDSAERCAEDLHMIIRAEHEKAQLKETGRFGPDRDRASEIDAGTAHMRTDRNVDFIREITEEVQAFKAKEEN